MNYKDIAVKNEQRLKQQNERLKILLYNTFTVLYDYCMIEIDDIEFLRDKIGITDEEYKEIME